MLKLLAVNLATTPQVSVGRHACPVTILESVTIRLFSLQNRKH